MNQQVKTSLGAAVLVIFAATALTFVWLIDRSRSRNQSDMTEITVNGSRKASVNDRSLEGWQTYRNEKYGFEVKYPSDWKAKDVQDGVVALSKDDEQINTISINIAPDSKYKSLANVIDEKIANLQIQKNTLETMIGGESAMRVKANGIVTFDGVYVKHGGNIYHLYIAEESKYLNIFNQILSTFKFTDTNETSNWQTYRNEKYGFEFQYPKSVAFISVDEQKFGSTQRLSLNVNGGAEWQNQPFPLLSVTISPKDEYEKLLKDPDSYSTTQAKAGMAKAVEANGRIYELSIGFQDGPDQWFQFIESSDYKKLLSTFKFTDTNGTSDWQTYRNEKYGFEVKYPTNWRFVETDSGAAFGPQSRREDTLFGINVVSEIPTLGAKAANREITKVEDSYFYGYPAKKVYTKNLSVNMEAAVLYVEKNGLIFSIGQPSLNESDYPFESEHNIVINQILASFNFIR